MSVPLAKNAQRDKKWVQMFFLLLMRLHTPDSVYYRFGDRLLGLDGWRPLHMRYPEHFGGRRG